MPDDKEGVQVTYRGPAPLASALVSAIEQEGGTVDWDAPEERRGAGQGLHEVVVGLFVCATYDVTKAAALAAARAGRDRFRARFPRPQVDVEDDD